MSSGGPIIVFRLLPALTGLSPEDIDVALMDIELPHLSGLEAAALLAEALPSCRVVMVTTFGRPG